MKKLTYAEFNKKSPEELANYSDEAIYAAAVAAKKINSGVFRVVQ